MAFTPINQLFCLCLSLIEITYRLVDRTTGKGIGKSVTITIISNTHVGLILWEKDIIITTSTIKDLTIVVHLLIHHILHKRIAFRRQTDVLDSIPTDTIHATGLQILDVLFDDGLHSRIVGIEVPHSNHTKCHLIAVIPVTHTKSFMIKTRVLQACSHVRMVSMVGNNIHNYLDTILMSLSTESLQVSFSTKTITYFKIVWTINIIPDGSFTCSFVNGRSLNGSKACLGDIRNFFLDICQRPVETMKDDTILNIVFKTIFVVCKDVGCHGEQHHQHQKTIIDCLFHILLLFSDDYFFTIVNIESWLSRLADTDTCDRIPGIIGCLLHSSDGSILYGCNNLTVYINRFSLKS